MITDEQLVEDADRQFKAISRRYRIAHRDEDDIRQEIRIALLRARERFDPRLGDWYDYSIRFAFGAVKDYFREDPLIGKRWRRDTKEAVFNVPYEELLHEVAVEDHHDSLELADRLKEFTWREQQIILLTIAGYSNVQIANITGISYNMVSRTVERLRIANSPSSTLHPLDLQQTRRAA